MVEKSNPLVSIIVVCYNHSNFIPDCFNSVLKQSYKNTELIVFDNGSTDGSTEILRSLQTEYGFLLICQENLGAPKTCNIAIPMAKGKYITFISTDDYWPLDFIELTVEFLEHCDEKIAVCGGTSILIDKAGKIYRKQTFNEYHELEFKDVFLKGRNIPAVTSIFRTKVLNEVGGFDERHNIEDASMWLKITYLGYRIAFLNKLLGYYRHHETNISHRRDDLIEGIRTMYGDYSHLPGYERALSNKFFRTFTRFLRIDKSYSFRFLRYVNIKYLKFSDIYLSLIFLLLPYKLIRRITRVI